MNVQDFILGLLAGLPIPIILLVILLLNPEKVEKWSAIAFKLLGSVGGIFRGAHKQYLRHDLQGRINEFVKSLSHDAPYLTSNRIRVEWVDPQITRKGFIEKDKVVLRLRRDDPEEANFVHGAFMFVSSSLLFKAKRYIAPSQRKAVDLYVTTKLLEKEKPSTVAQFLDAYLHPNLGDPEGKIGNLFDKFAKIDSGGYFYPVLLQELDFLGDKVFGSRKDQLIATEVNALIDFLEPVATRQVGQTTDLDFTQRYCRFAIVIVGKSYKLTPSGNTYVAFIKKHLIPSGIETIYVLGLWENRQVIQSICHALTDAFETTCTRRSTVPVRYGEDVQHRDQILAVLRRRGISVFQASE